MGSVITAQKLKFSMKENTPLMLLYQNSKRLLVVEIFCKTRRHECFSEPTIRPWFQ